MVFPPPPPNVNPQNLKRRRRRRSKTFKFSVLLFDHVIIYCIIYLDNIITQQQKKGEEGSLLGLLGEKKSYLHYLPYCLDRLKQRVSFK